MTLKERASSLKKDIPAVFLALKAKETPILAKIVAFLTVAYALSPIDLDDCKSISVNLHILPAFQTAERKLGLPDTVHPVGPLLFCDYRP